MILIEQNLPCELMTQIIMYHTVQSNFTVKIVAMNKELIYICIILFIIALLQAMALPAQNKTRTHDNSKQNRTQHTTHVVPKQNKVQMPVPRTTPRAASRITTPRRNKPKAVQHINNSKKTSFDSDDLISDVIGWVLDLIGLITEFQEMVEDWPIIG